MIARYWVPAVSTVLTVLTGLAVGIAPVAAAAPGDSQQVGKGIACVPGSSQGVLGTDENLGGYVRVAEFCRP